MSWCLHDCPKLLEQQAVIFYACSRRVSTTIRRARIGSRMACQADERTGNLPELPRSKAEIQGWFAGIALARSRIDAAA